MGDRTNHHTDVLHDLEGEKEGYAPERRGCCGKSEADKDAIQ